MVITIRVSAADVDKIIADYVRSRYGISKKNEFSGAGQVLNMYRTEDGGYEISTPSEEYGKNSESDFLDPED